MIKVRLRLKTQLPLGRYGRKRSVLALFPETICERIYLMTHSGYEKFESTAGMGYRIKEKQIHSTSCEMCGHTNRIQDSFTSYRCVKCGAYHA